MQESILLRDTFRVAIYRETDKALHGTEPNINTPRDVKVHQIHAYLIESSDSYASTFNQLTQLADRMDKNGLLERLNDESPIKRTWAAISHVPQIYHAYKLISSMVEKADPYLKRECT